MAAGDAHRVRLGHIVRGERNARGLSVRAAARAAGVDRATWDGVETATRVPQSHKAAQMEPVIGLAPGSFEAVLAGGEPTPLPAHEPASKPVDPRLARLRELFYEWREEFGREAAHRMVRAEADRLNAIEAAREQRELA